MCALAAAGLWWSFEQTAAAPDTSYVVARAKLVPGQVVGAADIDAVSMRLPTEVARTVFEDPRTPLGTVVVAAVRAGELLTRGDVVESPAATTRLSGYSIAVELERARALNGVLAAGEYVDIFATDRGSPGDGIVVADGALVLDVATALSGSIAGGTLTVTLLVDDLEEAGAVVAAADEGAITLVKVWS